MVQKPTRYKAVHHQPSKRVPLRPGHGLARSMVQALAALRGLGRPGLKVTQQRYVTERRVNTMDGPREESVLQLSN